MIIVTEGIILGRLIGIFMGGLVMAETKLVGVVVMVVAVIVVDEDIFSERMPMIKHMMVEPTHPSLLWRI
jgi:hypothetical protein